MSSVHNRHIRVIRVLRILRSRTISITQNTPALVQLTHHDTDQMLAKPCNRLERFLRWVSVDIEIANSEVLWIIRKNESAMTPVFCVTLGWRVDEIDIMTWVSCDQSPGFL